MGEGLVVGKQTHAAEQVGEARVGAKRVPDGVYVGRSPEQRVRALLSFFQSGFCNLVTLW